MTPDNALSICRFLHDAAAMMLWGTFGFIWVLVPARLAGVVDRKLDAFRLSLTAIAVLSTAAVLPLQTAIIGDGWQDALAGPVLFDVVTATSVGRAWLWQAAGALLLTGSLAAPRRFRTVATTIAAGSVLAGLALQGHAVMQDGWQAVVHPLNDVVHVLSGGAWVGALVPLILILSEFGKSTFRAEAAVALRAFSTVGHVAVGLVIASGLANSFFIVGSPIGWSNPYRALLTAKVVVVFVMTAIAIANRYWFVPRIGRNRRDVVQAIRLGTIFEIATGLTAIALVSVFGMLDPG